MCLVRALSVCVALASAAPAFAAQVLLVRPTGSSSTSYPTINAALAASADGDTLLIGNGLHAGFTIQGRAVTVIAPAGGATIRGPIVVRDTIRSQTVVLDGLSMQLPQGTGSSSTNVDALTVHACVGNVRVQHCTLTGYQGSGVLGVGDFYEVNAGGLAVRVENSPQVAFVRSTIRGGQGSVPVGGNGEGDFVGAGGIGLSVASSRLALYDCAVFGGDAGHRPNYLPDGGASGAPAVVLGAGASLYTCDSSIRGGLRQGGAFGGGSTTAGIGVVLNTGTSARFRNTTIQGGNASPATSGAGTFTTFADAGVKLDVASLGVQRLELTVTGQPNDVVFLDVAARARFDFGVNETGTGLVAASSSPVALTVLGPSGTASVSMQLPPLAPSVDIAQIFLQLYVRHSGGGRVVRGSSLVFTSLAHAQQPDCDGDGRNDVLATASGEAADCDGNFVPDVCQSDCDGDNVADGCELLAGTATDVNGNGLPDACETATFWVDDDALPGGNGSFGAPFQTLAAAFAVAPYFTTIKVQDGTYTGPANRQLDFLGRQLRVESVNGQANCIFDAQAATGPIFVVAGAEPVGTRIAGFTLRDARLADADQFGRGGAAVLVVNGSVEIGDCTFVNHVTENRGGAVYVENASATKRVAIHDCTFRGNRVTGASADAAGGALFVNASVDVLRCTFQQNQALHGAAIATRGAFQNVDQAARIAFCRFYRNVAAGNGGAIQSSQRYARIGDAVFAGNGAGGDGGAIFSDHFLLVTNTTFTANAAQGRGGACAISGDVDMRNSIAWGDSAPVGAELVYIGFGGSRWKLQANDVEGGTAGMTGMLVFDATLNVDVDPLFVDADGADDNPLTFVDNDLRLATGSPCIDFGHPSGVSQDMCDSDGDGNLGELVSFDLNGAPRRVDQPGVPNANGSPVDLGAYERP